MPDRIQTGFKDGQVQIHSVKEQVLHASAAETASLSSAAIIVGDYIEGILDINVTAVAGTTPSATFTLETFVNGGWRTLPNVTIAAMTAAGIKTVQVTNFGDQLRISWALTGTTPSFTFNASFVGKA